MASADVHVGQAITPKVEGPQISAGPVADNDGNHDHVKECGSEPAATATAPVEPLYSVLTPRQKQVTVMIVSFVALISPLSGNIYYPAIPALTREYHVSTTLIQLTITLYQIFQGIAPSFIANYSDSHGRRPAYAICLVIYLGANIGLALQSSYPALMVLRCLQSTGSSATVALAAGAVADMVTRAERGRFIAYASLGVSLGPVLAPVIGGLLTEYLGWRSIFWFLTICAAVLFAVYFILVPETARSVVGNGSVPPKSLLMTPSQYIKHKRNPAAELDAERATLKAARRRVNPFSALRILGEKEGGVTLGFGALMYGGYFMVLTTLPTELTRRFGFNAAQTGLCYIPVFVGTLGSRWTAGRLLDWNYKRYARRLGVEITKDRQQDLDILPIEAARLQVCIPMVYLTALCTVAFGWTMQTQSSLAGIEVTLFFLGIFNAGGLAGLSTLVVDTHQESPATATAANNLFRYLVSAGATAAAVPLIDRIGIGWTSVFIAGVFVVFSPCLWLVLFYGAKWRHEDKAKMDKAKQKRAEAKKEEASQQA
ncbi:putative MFS transporter [Diaporthe sp. PMI_573]|nr:putative MFS transporter [Diaporthaceae sp. PMI_573]